MKRLISICFAALMAAAPVSVMAQDANQIMARFNNEPTIEATQKAAVEYAGLDSSRLEGMYTRAGVARLLPKTASYEWKYYGEDLNRPQRVATYNDGNTEVPASDKRTTYDQNKDYMQHVVKAQWDLSGLIYNSDQLRVVSQMNAASKSRDTIMTHVTRAYFQRRKAQIDMITNPPKDVTARLNAELKIQELTATLDALTGGWFSKNIH